MCMSGGPRVSPASVCARRNGVVLGQGCGNPDKGLDKRNEVVGA